MLICPMCGKDYPPDTGDRCPDDGYLLYALGTDDGKRPLGPGDEVSGKYALLAEMPRRGGAGRTFKARQTHLEREVELRVLPQNSITSPQDHARFSREVATWGRLRNDHLVRLYDSGFTADNAPYMALEFVDGGSLGAKLAAEGPLSLPLVRTVAEHALRALEAAHDAAVLHRDISPDALLMGRRADGTPYVRLTGFGLAKHMGDDDDDPTAITMTGQVIGNPAYMAPEQIMMGTLEPRTDLYALGVTLYELTAGRKPHPGTTLSEMLKAYVQGTPDALRLHRPDVDPGLEGFIARLMAHDPAQRYGSATEALEALLRGDDRLDIQPTAPPSRATLAGLVPRTVAPAPTPGGFNLPLVVGVVLAIAGGAAAAYFLMR